MVAVVITGSAAAANNDKGSVPSKTLLNGSIIELEEEEEVDEVLPFRLIFLVLDSVTWKKSSKPFNKKSLCVPPRFPSIKDQNTDYTHWTVTTKQGPTYKKVFGISIGI